MHGAQIYLQGHAEAKTDWASDSTEMKRSGIEGAREQAGSADDSRKLLVAMRLGETPVPIPNTMVKT